MTAAGDRLKAAAQEALEIAEGKTKSRYTWLGGDVRWDADAVEEARRRFEMAPRTGCPRCPIDGYTVGGFGFADTWNRRALISETET